MYALQINYYKIQDETRLKGKEKPMQITESIRIRKFHFKTFPILCIYSMYSSFLFINFPCQHMHL
jgi:hypothetical protein